MIRKALILKIFSAAYMQRWNDKVRPVELVELDKQAHKMVIAYCLGKYEEESKGFSWTELIEGGLFELLQRLVITDLKPPIFYRIREDRDKYKQLNEWIYNELEPLLSPIGVDFCKKFKNYFVQTDDTLCKRILSAAHLCATKWEFDIIERANPNGFEIEAIKQSFERKQEQYRDLTGIDQLIRNQGYRNFIDLCGQLRFQVRWANLHRVPRTSVMGHMLFVAILSYLFSLEISACEKRCANNYFTGLFHDLPEVLTRDIISPVKRSIEGLAALIKDYEKELMEKEVFGLIPSQWHGDMRMYTEDEFDNRITINGAVNNLLHETIEERYNRDHFNPRDGALVKAADNLAAFIEAHEALKNGSSAREFQEAKIYFREHFRKAVVSGINFGEIYADFE